MTYLRLGLISLFPLLLAWAVITDLTSLTIRNWIPLAVSLLFLISAAAFRLSLKRIGLHFLCGFIALVIGMILFAIGWIGGGDAKLFAVACLWLGWPACRTSAWATPLAGAIVTGLFMLLRSETQESVPYAPAIAAGALAAMRNSTLFKAVRATSA
jgi:prepilin peptidase CpaA